MKPLSDRTAHFTDSVIRRMTRVANRYGAVNLSQGFPDFDPPNEITDRVKKVHDFLTVGAAAPLMEAAVTGLNFGDDYYEGLQAHYTHMKNLFTGGLRNLGFTFTDPQGAYYVLMDVSEFGVRDDYKFCEWMTREVGVATVPGSSFFKEDVHTLIRFHFAKEDATLNDALNRLETLREKANAATDVDWR